MKASSLTEETSTTRKYKKKDLNYIKLGVENAKGVTVFGRTMLAGDVFYVPNTSGLKAKFGNAGAVDIWVDGELAPKVGANKTSKKDVSLNPDSLMKKAK